MNKVPHIVSFGGGTNSTAMLIGMVRREVIPDAILFADTGGELPEVYEHIEKFSEWLVANKCPAVTWVRKVDKDGERLTLEQECLNAETLPSLAFGFKTCSQKHKMAPQDKWLNNWQPAQDCWASGGRVLKFIGFDAGPRDRLRAKPFEDAKYINVYPLITWEWDRKKCEEVCREEGFTPAKSSCFFCPAMKKREVVQLSLTHPDLLKRAIAMEHNAAPNLQTIKGLGRHWTWESVIRADKAQGKMCFLDDAADDMPCGCYDG